MIDLIGIYSLYFRKENKNTFSMNTHRKDALPFLTIYVTHICIFSLALVTMRMTERPSKDLTLAFMF